MIYDIPNEDRLRLLITDGPAAGNQSACMPELIDWLLHHWPHATDASDEAADERPQRQLNLPQCANSGVLAWTGPGAKA